MIHKTELKPGDKVMLIRMVDDPDPLPHGATGTIRNVFENSQFVQFDVVWDAPNQRRTIMPCCPPDILVRTSKGI